jgi:hypothetical protein
LNSIHAAYKQLPNFKLGVTEFGLSFSGGVRRVLAGPQEPVVMARVLCLDSSSLRLVRLARVLQRAGWEVWTGADVRDVLLLASLLKFEAVVADEASTRQFPELWEQAEEVIPELRLLVHSPEGERAGLRRTGIAAGSPELVLAMLTLLLAEGRQVNRAAA